MYSFDAGLTKFLCSTVAHIITFVPFFFVVFFSFFLLGFFSPKILVLMDMLESSFERES